MSHSGACSCTRNLVVIEFKSLVFFFILTGKENKGGNKLWYENLFHSQMPIEKEKEKKRLTHYLYNRFSNNLHISSICNAKCLCCAKSPDLFDSLIPNAHSYVYAHLASPMLSTNIIWINWQIFVYYIFKTLGWDFI